MPRWRSYRWERPDWWLIPVAALAWAALAVEELAAPAHAHHGAHGALAPAVGWWCVMVLAMMLPLARRDAGWLAHRSLARMRSWMVASHAAAFLAVWCLAGVGVVYVMGAVDAGTDVAAGALVTAAAWHLTPFRRRTLRRCSAGRAPAIRGVRATFDAMVAGRRTASRCLVTCGPAMVAMAAAHSLPLMTAVWAIGASERRPAPNALRRAGRPVEAAALAAVALAVASGAPGL